VLELSDVSWTVYFRESRRVLSCGLANCSTVVESLSGRRCQLIIADVEDDAFGVELRIRAPARRLARDLDRRRAELEYARRVVDAVAAGDWWMDARVFDGLEWARTCSIAGVRYRHGWWGTGRIKPTMSAKVLDLGPAGIRFRGWRTRFLVPWDVVGSIWIIEGDAWVLDASDEPVATGSGSTIVIRSRSGQDAVFYTPLMQADAVRELIDPLSRRIHEPAPAAGEVVTS
jgi:hypothetical protein